MSIGSVTGQNNPAKKKRTTGKKKQEQQLLDEEKKKIEKEKQDVIKKQEAYQKVVTFNFLSAVLIGMITEGKDNDAIATVKYLTANALNNL